jgi:hypothetical protein
MANPKLSVFDYPSPFVTSNLKAPGTCISIGICMFLYIIAYFGVQFWLRFKNKPNKEFYECQKKAWIFVINVIGIYCYNRVSVATAIILWFATVAQIGTLAICAIDSLRLKLFKFAMTAALSLTLINVIVHFLTRAATSGNTSLAIQGTIIPQ